MQETRVNSRTDRDDGDGPSGDRRLVLAVHATLTAAAVCLPMLVVSVVGLNRGTEPAAAVWTDDAAARPPPSSSPAKP
jgi:hypothetical protein